MTTMNKPKLTQAQLLEAYRWAYMSRRVDDREITMKKQNKVFFQISGAGHELPQIAAAMVMQPGKDWAYLYYRDRAFCLAYGMTPYDMFLSSVGAADDINSRGRQMPSHWGSKELNIASTSSPTGTQFLQALGSAEAARFHGQGGDKEVVLVTTGDGTTSEGEFWEALNTACNLKAPVIFMVEDNGYAISVPVEVQTAGGNISGLVSNWPNLFHQEIDGCDFEACHQALEQAVAYCREGKGPAFVHAHVVRPYSHSMSDDEKFYKSEAERQAEAEKDPIKVLGETIVGYGFATEAELESLRTSIDNEVAEAAEKAEVQPQPAQDTVYDNVYSPSVDPTSSAFATEAKLEGQPKTVVDLINACLKDEMRRNEKIVVFGEDVADATREEVLSDLKGKGGVFKVTAGLQKEFGKKRVFNSPLAEANIVGRAIGMAQRGLKPVVEVQFFDYIWPAYHQIRNELATMRWRSGGYFSCPMVIRVPIGGYLKGGGPYHSQSGEVLFTHIPGLRVIMPSNAEDANGLLRTAIRCDDPVLFLEHKHLYRQTYNKGLYPGDDYMIPFGKAKVVQEGTDLTIITYGALVHRSLTAVRELQEQGFSVEILDLRSLAPYDWDAIVDSVKKTSKVLIAHEDCLSFGFGAEIAARISSELFEYLDGPVERIGATDTFVGYAPQLEEVTLPQVNDIRDKALELIRY